MFKSGQDEAVNKKTITKLGESAIWVTLLLGLRSNNGVLQPEEARDLLFKRFDKIRFGPPTGIRVYAARVTDEINYTNSTSYQSGSNSSI